MGPVCFFCDSLLKGKGKKVGPLRGRAERAFRKQNTSRGILFVGLVLVGRGVSLRVWRLFFFFLFLRDCEME